MDLLGFGFWPFTLTMDQPIWSLKAPDGVCAFQTGPSLWCFTSGQCFLWASNCLHPGFHQHGYPKMSPKILCSLAGKIMNFKAHHFWDINSLFFFGGDCNPIPQPKKPKNLHPTHKAWIFGGKPLDRNLRGLLCGSLFTTNHHETMMKLDTLISCHPPKKTWMKLIGKSKNIFPNGGLLVI